MTTVLVVDDGRVDQRLAGGFVEREGMVATYASNGAEALKSMDEQLPDIVLTDLQMPEMNGLELVRAVRAKYPGVPVMLMTAFGSELIAVEALQCGAASYVPKSDLKTELVPALRVVLESTNVADGRKIVRQFFQYRESQFVLGQADWKNTQTLVNHLQEELTESELCDETGLIRVGTALTEALANAIDHGCLELDSALRESEDDAYRKLAEERSTQTPYCERRVHVTARVTPEKATFVIRDEGSGFDPESLPDPTDPENLLKPSGRGILLIRTFMTDVRFNDQGNEITMNVVRKKC